MDNTLSKAVVTANSSGGFNIVRIEKVKILASAPDKASAEEIAAMFNRRAATVSREAVAAVAPAAPEPKAEVKTKVVRRRRRRIGAKKSPASTGAAKVVKTKAGAKKGVGRKRGPKPGTRRRAVPKEGVDMEALTSMVESVSSGV